MPNVPNDGTGTSTYNDIGPYELGPPGPPTDLEVLEWGDTYAIVRWSARGDEWDVASAGTWKFVVNGTEAGSPASCNAPGGVHTETVNGLSSCQGYTLKVRITAQDGTRRSESNDASGTTCCGPECEATRPGARAVSTLEDTPLGLAAPQPNPTDGMAKLSWSIPRHSTGQAYEVGLFDVAGRRLATVEKGVARPGTHSQMLLTERVQDLGRGVYFVRLQVGDERLSRALIIK